MYNYQIYTKQRICVSNCLNSIKITYLTDKIVSTNTLLFYFYTKRILKNNLWQTRMWRLFSVIMYGGCTPQEDNLVFEIRSASRPLPPTAG